MKKTIVIAALIFLWMPLSFAVGQQKKSSNSGTPVFKMPVNIVVVHATVNDKQGNPVTDLNQTDFKIYEDGKPQEINSFSQESYIPEQAAEQGAVLESSEPENPKSKHASSSASTKPRMIALFVDDLAMQSIENFPRMNKAIADYIRNGIGPSDQVAVFSASGDVQLPFSGDKQALLDHIADLPYKLNSLPSWRSECPKMTDYQAYQVAVPEYKLVLDNVVLQAQAQHCPVGATKDDANYYVKSKARQQYEESVSRKRRLIDAFRLCLRALKHFEAIKSIVFFSDGFLSFTEDNTTYQIQELIDQALNSGVVINCINIRGLETGMDASRTQVFLTPEMADALGTSSGPLSGVNDWIDDMLVKEWPLQHMSVDTGGELFHNNNNIYKGIQEIVRKQSHYYVLTYATPSVKADGLYHRIKVEVMRPGLEASYRKGFYASKEEMTFEKRKKEDILDALLAPGNLNEIPVSMSYNYYAQDDAFYSVSFVTKVDIARLRFQDEDARRKNLISVVLVAYDENNKFMDGVEKTIDFKLLESSYADLRQRGIRSKVELKLPAGHYRIKAVVREGVQGKMGSFVQNIEIQ
jgi:VWFA-related protein